MANISHHLTGSIKNIKYNKYKYLFPNNNLKRYLN